MGPTGHNKLTCCVLDGGSHLSFITKTLVDDLKLEVVDCHDLVLRAFESQSSDSGPRRVMHLGVKSIWKNTTVPITAFESTHAFWPNPTVPHDITIMAQTHKIQLADPREGEWELTISPNWRGLLLENSKEYFYNTPVFITGFTPHEVRLDFD